MSSASNDQNSSLVKEALLNLRRMKAKLDAVEKEKSEPIAIVGLGCRFAQGGDSPEAFFSLLREGVDTITEVPGDRWDIDAYYDPDPDAPGKMYTRRGGFLDQVDQFDAAFFGISTREAVAMDPQQRLLLELCWEALEQAGQVPSELRGSQTGVFLSGMNVDYAHLNTDPAAIDIHSSAGSVVSVAAGRLAYVLGVHGPTLVVDTACSSSLVAVHLACQSLRRKECDQALTGGVHLTISPLPTILECRTRMLSPDGRCKTFDAAANGFVRGEGGGMMVLKRLSDAVADGDNVLALIRGTAINHDGRSSGLSVPNGMAQQAVIRAALQDARVEPGDIGYIEAHGTGTSLGDPIEIGALGAVFGRGRSADKPLLVGSVKTNLGHLESAAGVAGLIKTVASLRQKEIPPHINFETPNPLIAWDEWPLRIPQSPEPWPVQERRLAGVSSFGFSGTNAHVVLEESPPAAVSEVQERGAELLVLSGKSEAALSAQVERYRTHLAKHSELSLEDICYTAGAGRSHFTHRQGVVASTRAELCERLDQLANGKPATGVSRGEVAEGGGKLAFMFTGQGAQYAGMAQALYDREPVFRSVLDRCAACLDEVLERPLLEVMFESPAGVLDETGYTQPALYALETGLAALWASWGIEPAVVMGHSVGEYAAAQVAGVFELEDGARLIAARARLMQALPAGGAMVAVLAPLARVQPLLSGLESQVSVAALNGPENVVLSGEAAAIEPLCEALERDGVMCRRLRVSHAFHSPLMEPMLAAFREAAQRVNYQVPRLAVISNVTGKVAGERMASADYWVEHVRSPVRFAEGVACAAGQGVSCYLELGPKPTLLGMARASVADSQWLASLQPGQADVALMLESLGALYVRGHSVNWSGVYAGRGYRKVVLPTYPFQRQRYWVKNTEAAQTFVTQKNQLPDWLYAIDWQSKTRVTLDDVEPAPGYWLLFAGAAGTGEVLARLLRERGQDCLTVTAAESYRYPERLQCSINPDSAEDFDRLLAESDTRLTVPLLGIIDLYPAEMPAATSTIEDLREQGATSSCRHLLNLVQALARTRQVPQYGVWAVTRASMPMNDDKGLPGIAHAGLWGMGRTIALEHPDVWGGMIDLDSGSSDDEAERLLTDILDPQDETQIAYRGGERLVPRLTKKSLDGQQTLRAEADATYLITGGLGGLGLCVAGWLADCDARHLVLLARSEPLKDARTLIAQLEERGIEVVVAQADVTDRNALASVLRDIAESDYPLRGIIHAAGQLQDATLQELDWPQFERVLAPKVLGSWHLHQLTSTLPLDFFVMFSSAAAVFGSAGQANYAAANAFLDALAHHRKGQGLPALSINWGPWAQAGMAARMDKRGSDRLSLRGIDSIDVSSGLALLGQLMVEQSEGEKSAQTAVMSVRWEELSQRALSGSPLSSFLEQLLVDDSTQSSPLINLDELRHRSIEARTDYLLRYLKVLAAGIFQSEVEVLSEDQDLLALGADSLMIMEMLDCIRRDLQLMVYPREIYANPKLAVLAKYLATELIAAGPSDSDVQSESSSTDRAMALQTMDIPGVNEGLPEGFQRLPAAVFLLSSPRAGSTLLRTMLAGHPQLFSPPELHLLPFATMGQRHAHLREAYLDEGLQRALMELKGIDAAQAQSIVDGWVAEDIPVCEVYGELQALCAPRVLVDKSPSYAADRCILERAEAVFGHARYIHLVRHPISVIESFVRMRMDRLIATASDDPYSLAEQVWLDSNRNIEEFVAGLAPDQAHRLSFEALVTDPDAVVRQLCDFLAIPFDPVLLNPYAGERMADGIHGESLSIGDPNFMQHRRIEADKSDAWKIVELPHGLDQETMRFATSLGYGFGHVAPVKAAQSDAAPIVKMTEQYIDVRGLSLCLCCWGEQDAPLIVLLHGILDQGAAWDRVAVELARAGYRVIAPDLRGHGRSASVAAGASYNFMDYLADIDALIEQLADEPFTLVGHSMGSILAALYASTRSEKLLSLVLVETVLPAREKDEAGLEQIETHLDYLMNPPTHKVFADVQAAAEHLRRMTPALSPAFADHLTRRITRTCDGGVTWSWDPRLSSRAGIAFGGVPLGRAAYLKLLEGIDMPTTLLFGKSSQFNRPVDLADIRRALGSADQYSLDGGHQLHVEASQNVGALVVRAAARGDGYKSARPGELKQEGL